jgi:hypothetical protein
MPLPSCVTLRALVYRYQRFGETCCVHLQGKRQLKCYCITKLIKNNHEVIIYSHTIITNINTLSN